MYDNQWDINKTTYNLPEGYGITKAKWEEFSTYFAVYEVFSRNVWFRQSFDKARAVMTDCESCYWVQRNGKRIGGVILEPNYINCLSLIPPNNEVEKVLIYLKDLLMIWSDRSQDIMAGSIKPDQLRMYQRIGFRELETRRCMIRPTEKFDVAWDARFLIQKPQAEYKTQLIELFTEAFQGAAGLEGKLSTADVTEHIQFYLENYCNDELLQKASSLLLDKQSGALAGACLVSLWEEWPNIYLVGVDSNYTGRGLASNMLKNALTQLHEHYPVCRLFVTLGNDAELLYHKLGFMAGVETTKLYIPAQQARNF